MDMIKIKMPPAKRLNLREFCGLSPTRDAHSWNGKRVVDPGVTAQRVYIAIRKREVL